MKRLSLLLYAISAAFFYSCDDEKDPAPDTEKPTVEIISPGEADFYKGTLQIEASAEDNKQIKSVKLYIDETLIKEVEGNAISESWDSKTVEDGVHTLKVLATDTEDNETLVTTEINILNYFFVLDVSDAQLNETVNYWYFISRADGSLVGIKQLVSGLQEIKFETPDDFSVDKKYTLVQFYHLPQQFSTSNNITVQLNYIPGKYKFSPKFATPTNPSGPSTPIGEYLLQIENFATPFSWVVNGEHGGISMSSTTGDLFECKISLIKNGTNVSLALQRNYEGTPRYIDLENISVGESSLVNYDELDLFEVATVPASEDALSFSTQIYGYPEQGNYNQSVWLWSHYYFQDPNKIREHFFYHRGNRYPEYQFIANESYANSSAGYIRVGTTPPTEFKKANVTFNNFAYDGSTISANVGGTFDVLSVGGSKLEAGNQLNFWSVVMGGGNEHQIILPVIPDEILQYGLPQRDAWQFNTLYYSDYSGFDGYEEYRDFSLNGSGSVYTVSKEYLSGAFTIDNSGGRKSLQQKPVTIEEAEAASARFGGVPLFHLPLPGK